MITLSDETTTIILPSDLIWIDELSWTPVASSQEFGTTGAQFIDVSVKLAGRPITLKAEDDEHSWIARAVLLSLQTMSAFPGNKITLTIYDATYTVVFAPGKKPFEAEPVWHQMPMDDADKYILTAINFVTV